MSLPQGNDLSPDPYNIFTSDIPQTQNATLATYADDTSNFSSNIVNHLQHPLPSNITLIL